VRGWILGVVVVGLLAGQGRAQEAELARGAALLAPFKRQLQEALRAGLAQGPVEAVEACQLRAPEIPEALSVGGIRLGRSSQRLRNPANAPPNWVRPILDRYAQDPGDRAPKLAQLSTRRLGYAEPILVQPLCVTCHGVHLAPEVAEKIAALYPEDAATGYEVGELRGVFWVEFPGAE